MVGNTAGLLMDVKKKEKKKRKEKNLANIPWKHNRTCF